MEQFDKMMKELAEKEEIIVPNGFDERMQAALNDLPPKTKKRGLGAMKAAFIAAAACLLLMGTALAASPELRGMLAEALGGFAPYAHEQEGETYVIDGIEFKVVSALADDFTVKVYVEARDLEGDRLSKLELNTFGSAFGVVDVPSPGDSISMFLCGVKCAAYDEGTKTALLVFTTWGQFVPNDLTGVTVKLFSLTGYTDNAYQQVWGSNGGVSLPVEIEPVSSLVVGRELASALGAEEMRLSSLGLSVIFRNDGNRWVEFDGSDVRVQLADGTMVEAPWGKGGMGGSGEMGAENARKVLVWNFLEPLAPDEVVGIYVNGEYFPVK